MGVIDIALRYSVLQSIANAGRKEADTDEARGPAIRAVVRVIQARAAGDRCNACCAIRAPTIPGLIRILLLIAP